jgi:hypothetical protein
MYSAAARGSSLVGKEERELRGGGEQSRAESTRVEQSRERASDT